MSPLSDMMELCQYNQKGFCKFGDKCLQKHENEICQNRSQCTIQYCTKRHPGLCRYFCQFGHCKFGEACAYSHVNDSKSHKEEMLERDVAEMREEMKNLKAELSDKIEKEVVELKKDVTDKLEKEEVELKKYVTHQLEKEVVELKKEVTELKENVQFLKRVLGKMLQSIKLLEGETEVKDKGNSNEKNESDNKVDDGKKEEEKTLQEKEEQNFNCDKCDYKAKRKNTLTKHMNTKHCVEEKKKPNTGVDLD